MRIISDLEKRMKWVVKVVRLNIIAVAVEALDVIKRTVEQLQLLTRVIGSLRQTHP